MTLKLKIGWTNLRTKHLTQSRSKSLSLRARKGDCVGKLTKGNVEFESVLATYDHREGQIKAMIEQIKSEQIHQMLVFHDQCYEDDEDTVFERLEKDVFDEEIQKDMVT